LDVIKVTSKIGHWLHFGILEQMELTAFELKDYFIEALELEKAYFKPQQIGVR
jgi:hypothetical protein